MAECESGAELVRLREQIDVLDGRLLKLINDRARIAVELARVKQSNRIELYSPERERAVLCRLAKENSGPLDDRQLSRLFRELMSSCLSLQERCATEVAGERCVTQSVDGAIACLGPEGTFSHVAVLRHFGPAAKTRFHDNVRRVFRDVGEHKARLGVVPVENSTEGGVNDTLSLLQQSARFGVELKAGLAAADVLGAPCLWIRGELEMRIHHHLLSNAAELGAIHKVGGHPQSLAQCRAWLDEKLPGAQRIPYASSAEAALQAACDPELAAVAGTAAAERYHLSQLASDIEDRADNTTRFLLFGPGAIAPPSGSDKTSLLLSAVNCAGALHSILGCFARQGVSLTFVQSRPSWSREQRAWEYEFFVDLEGHVQDDPMWAALTDLHRHASCVRLLGSYPRAYSGADSGAQRK